MQIPKYIYWTFLLLLSSLILTGQDVEYSPQKDYQESEIEAQKVNERTWEKATKNLDYKTRKQKDRKIRDRSGKLGGDGRQLMTILLIVFGGIALALLIAYLLGYLKVGKKEEKGTIEVSIEDIEENIFETDLQVHIRQALEQEDYTLAVRLYFLSALKELSLQKKIKWKKDKTNRIYAIELSNTKHHNQFRRLALIFDRTRYGRASLDKDSFPPVQEEFVQFINQLNPSLLSMR